MLNLGSWAKLLWKFTGECYSDAFKDKYRKRKFPFNLILFYLNFRSESFVFNDVLMLVSPVITSAF